MEVSGMLNFESVDAVLDFAIDQEAQAAAFYSGMAGKMDRPWMKKVFEGFAKEEMGHKAKLEQVKQGKMLKASKEKVLDLKIAEYVVDEEVSVEMDYQAALIVAMKKEKAAFRLYSDLAEAADDPGLSETFLALAQEEAKHKLRFEVEYDQYVLADN
jgi:rubrerythrin